MELKEVIHYYIGCDIELNNGGSKVKNRTLAQVGKMADGVVYYTLSLGKNEKKAFRHIVFENESRIKPILRRLSSMTEEEGIILCSLNLPKGWQPGHIIKTNYEDIAAMRIFDMKGDYKTLYIPKNRISPSNFVWLLKHGFDLFGLIDSNQAIDRDK